MLESLNKSRSLKSDANAAHQNFLQVKQKVDESHKKCAELLHQVRSFRQKLQEKEEEKQAQRQVELREQLEAIALKKLKQGEKLTWEEFKILAEQGKIESKNLRKLKERREEN